MQEYIYFILLAAGLAVIAKSADLVVGSTSKLAKGIGVPVYIIGLTVVAFGTSIPELVVAVLSGVSHANRLSLGNVIGSSAANTALIIGVSAIIYPFSVTRPVVYREVPMSFLAQLILLAMVSIGGVLSRVDGIILLLLFALFLLHIGINTLQPQDTHKNTEDGRKIIEGGKLLKPLLLIAIGAAGLFAGGRIIVDSSIRIAAIFGLSETLIGVTIVAIGTTMPELVTNIIAALRKESGIIMGNCIGSNIFNILLVLGVTSVIYPIDIPKDIHIDLIIVLVSTLMLQPWE